MLTFLTGLRYLSFVEALLAASMMALLGAPLDMSQYAQIYRCFLTFSLLATYLWLMILAETREGRRLSRWLQGGYCLASLAASFLHYFGAFLIGLQCVAAK